jgi:hypothetical protein
MRPQGLVSHVFELASVHPETVNFWMLGDLRPRSLGSDAHQKRFPGVLVNSIMSK